MFVGCVGLLGVCADVQREISSSFATFSAYSLWARHPVRSLSNCILHLGSLMNSYCSYKIYFFNLLVFLRQGLLMCSPGLPGTLYVDHAGPELRRFTLNSDPQTREICLSLRAECWVKGTCHYTYLLCLFETGSHYRALAGLELTTQNSKTPPAPVWD